MSIAGRIPTLQLIRFDSYPLTRTRPPSVLGLPCNELGAVNFVAGKEQWREPFSSHLDSLKMALARKRGPRNFALETPATFGDIVSASGTLETTIERFRNESRTERRRCRIWWKWKIKFLSFSKLRPGSNSIRVE